MIEINFLICLFEKLEGEHIRYAVLWNYELLPASTGGSDIDIWVHSDDCKRFFDIIEDTANDYKGTLVSYIWKRYES